MICLIEPAGHGQGSIPALHLAVTLAVTILGAASILSGIWYVARSEDPPPSPGEFLRDAPLPVTGETPLR